jgi:NAD(P)-dependent dehydrogenase (short-subunit alcohol dehydrogenase family)
MSLKRTVIVSGGTYGIGRGITLTLAERGWQVVAFGLEAAQPGSAAQNGIAGTRAALAERGLSAELLEADVANADDVEQVVSSTAQQFGGINAVVNNAAIRPTGSILETDEATFDRTVAVNLKGIFLLSKSALPTMIAAGGGAIVNIGSGAGWGKPGIAAYCASKGGVIALSTAMAYDHLNDGIRVNIVVPGPQTQSGQVEAIAKQRELPPVATVTGRGNQPQDVANAVAFLLSDEAEQISGTIMDIGCFAHQGGGLAGKPGK